MFRKNIGDWISERRLYGIKVFSEDDRAIYQRVG